MAPKDKNEQPSLTQSFVGLFQSWLSLFVELFELAALELRLAGKSLIFIVFLSIGLIFLAIMSWIFLMAAGAAWLVSYHWTWGMAFLGIVGLHLLGILITLRLLVKAKYHLTFPETRKQLGIVEENKHEINDEKITEKH